MQLLRWSEEFIETVNAWDGSVEAPSPQNRKKTGIRVFANPFVENYLAKAHPIVPGLWALPLAGVGIYYGIRNQLPWYELLGTCLTGVLLWTLTEYLLHRFLFHMKPKDTFESKARLFLMHGYHHEFPNDKYRLVAPR